MRIGEVAKETGLTISNIRFYEKKGLLEPDREADSKYRDYSKEDVDRLKLIILYRKMDLSVENIEEILCGKTSLKDALCKQVEDLRRQQEILQGSIDLCEEIIAKNDVSDENVDYYLNYIKEEESKGKHFVQINDMLSDYADMMNSNRWILPQLPFGGAMSYKTERALRTVFGLFFLMLPIILMVMWYFDEGVPSIYMVVIFIFLLILCWEPFIRIWNSRKKK